MLTISQLIKKKRKKKIKVIRLKALKGSPFRKGVCVKVYITKPKKPNSANRKVAKIKLSSKSSIIAAIPGNGHNLMQYSTVLVRGGRAPDLPGVKYKIIRGKFDFISAEFLNRNKKRSKFGKKRGIKV